MKHLRNGYELFMKYNDTHKQEDIPPVMLPLVPIPPAGSEDRAGGKEFQSLPRRAPNEGGKEP